MSLEKDITRLMEDEIFKPASKPEIKQRKEDSWKMMTPEERINAMESDFAHEITDVVVLLYKRYKGTDPEEFRDAFIKACNILVGNTGAIMKGLDYGERRRDT